MASTVDLRPGYILHRRRYRDTSLLLEAFTRDTGRIGLIARGAASSSTRGALLQPFTALELAWRGRGEVPTLARAERDGPPLFLRGNALAAGFYVNELLVRLWPRNEPAGALYDSYIQILGGLHETDFIPCLRRFELALLDALGYGLDLQSVVGAAFVRFAPDEEPVPVATNDPSPWTTSGATITALLSGDLTDTAVRTEARRLLGAMLDFHLGGQPLRSRELLSRRGTAI